MECESKLFLDNCNCIMYYMPKIYNDVNICGRTDDECISHMRSIQKLKVNQSVDCDCLPSCNIIEFQAEVSSAPILNPVPLLPNLSTQEIENISILQIFFRENSFWAKKREEIFGFTQFLCKFYK